jgi:hypothetical protein
LDTAFDLHRFDLVKALHLDLPADTSAEEELATKLTRFWQSTNAKIARSAWRGTRYWHYDEKIRPTEDSDAAEDKDARHRGYL